MKIIKRNQVVVAVVALMLVAAGYLNYSSNDKEKIIPTSSNTIAGIGDAKLVSNNDVIEGKNEINDVIENTIKNDKKEDSSTNIPEEKYVSAKVKDDYFASSRLGRDTMYSQMIESYQKILDNNNISQEQKTIATQEISNINTIKNAIMISENLIKTKGISDVVVFSNDKSINVIVKSENLEQDKIAQIHNIVSREMKAEIENIHISMK